MSTEYEQNERHDAYRHIEEVKKAPLADRKAAAAAYAEAMTDPVLVAERIGWLLDGNYGYGAMLRAKEAARTRGNSEAQLSTLVAAFEWQCPADLAIKAWKTLTAAQKAKLSKAIEKEVKRWKKGQE